MPWVIGIDEAGYGPNLGPLVQAAAMAKLPASDLAGWDFFRHKIRRAHEPKDDRLLVDDSKKVHKSGTGLETFESTLSGWYRYGGLRALIKEYGVLNSIEDYESEYCFPQTYMLTYPCPDCPIRNAGLFPQFLHVVTPQRLNRIIEKSNSKAPALLSGYTGLIQNVLRFIFNPEYEDWTEGDEAIIIADKFGGRHYYSSLLQQTFPDGWVVTEYEQPEESRYRVENLPIKLTAIFRPKADSGSICVALASMMAKYVREWCMQEFNAFWARHVRIQPTAGYPVDAKRFYREIEPAMKKLGIPKEAVWRMK